jgi:hypothetical protein
MVPDFSATPRAIKVDLQAYGGGGELAYSTLDQDGAVGRFFLVGATYKF